MEKLMLRKLSVVTQLKCDKAEVQTQQPVSVAPALEFDFPELSPSPREIHNVRILLPLSPITAGCRDCSVLLGKLLGTLFLESLVLAPPLKDDERTTVTGLS